MRRLLLASLSCLWLALPARAQLPNSFIQSPRTTVHDWNNNGIPDHLEAQGLRDWNKNGIPDYLEGLPSVSMRDWNFDGVPDYYQQDQPSGWYRNYLYGYG